MLDPEEVELKEMRRELNDLRAEYESFQKQNIASHPVDRTDFSTQFQGAIAAQLRRRYAVLRIERRLSALEKRVADFEARRNEALN